MSHWFNGRGGKRRQELYCHGCSSYVQFTLDLDLDGNHVLECPKCKHEHCRVVRNGEITDIRWDQRNGDLGAVWTVSGRGGGITTTTTSTFSSSTSTSFFLYQSWSNSGTT